MYKIVSCFLYFIFFTIQIFANPIVLVTGGAGYIGSHTCKALKEAGYDPVVYDSLSLGSFKSVKWGPLIIGDLLNQEKLDAVFDLYRPVAIIHFAGLCNVGDSVIDPLSYYNNNLAGSLNLLNAMYKYGVKQIVFSSSCTVYGDNKNDYISEDEPKSPTNPYAFSKYVIEKMIEDYSKAYGLDYVILRYFNAAGIDLESEISRTPNAQYFLIPQILLSLIGKDNKLKVFGNDYPTHDGTAIRDFIHVKDLSRAHVLALDHLQKGKENIQINLGTGKGFSILEIIKTIEDITKQKVFYEIMPRRPGDVPIAIADITKAKKILDFSPIHSDIKTIIENEWISLNNSITKEKEKL